MLNFEYAHAHTFFSFCPRASCMLRAGFWNCCWLGALGWNTLTSKKASWRVFQKPLARMSSRAPSSVLVEASLKDSPDSGCKCGSMYIARIRSGRSRERTAHLSTWQRLMQDSCLTNSSLHCFIVPLTC